MRRLIFSLVIFGLSFSLFMTVACRKLEKDGVYEAKAEGLSIRLELPAQEGVTQRFQELRKNILHEIGQDEKTGLYHEYQYGKLILENHGTTPLQKGFSPPKVLITLNKRKPVESEALQVMIDRLVKESDRMGRNVAMEEGSPGAWTHEFAGEKYKARIVHKDDPVGQCWITVWENFHQMQKLSVAPMTLVKLEINNGSSYDISNPMTSPQYSLELESAKGVKAQAVILEQAVTNIQRDIDKEQSKPEVQKSVSLYNAFAILYNESFKCLEKATPLRRDLIAPGQASTEYFVAYGIVPKEVNKIRLKGGRLENAGHALYQEVVNNMEFPLQPGGKIILYMGFPPFSVEDELRGCHFTIGSLFVELR